MTLHSFVDRLAQLFSWLYYQHQWEEWELLAIASAALVPLLLIVRQHRKEKAGRIRHQGRERSPIIGVKLANGRHSRVKVTDSKKARLDYLARGKTRQSGATEEADSSNERIRQLQSEITRHRQVEARLEQQLAELTATNEKLQHEISEIKHAEEQLQQQSIKLPAANKRLRQGFARGRLAEEFPGKQAGSGLAANKHPQSNDAEDVHVNEGSRRPTVELLDAGKLPPEDLNRPDQGTCPLKERPKHRPDSKLADEPLDVEKLKAIAALARQIQERPRPDLRQTQPPASD